VDGRRGFVDACRAWFLTGDADRGAVGLVAGLGQGPLTPLSIPYSRFCGPISPIAWIRIAILWFGVGNASPIYLIFISSVFPMIVQTAAGVHTIERRYLHAAQNFGVSRYTLFRRVVVPAVLPQIIVGMRIGLGVAWLVVVAAEMIALRSGLGYLIIDCRNAGDRYDLVIAEMIIIGLIGLLLDGTMRLLEGLKSVKWRYARLDRGESHPQGICVERRRAADGRRRQPQRWGRRVPRHRRSVRMR
jgi:NitT/TauT family transport system permease protein